ncbi:MAG: DUF2889 domain-containing protein [Chloroflexi bacterium]|nr:DUF2889 domain-containing protein [Chloroflexota bacterium]
MPQATDMGAIDRAPTSTKKFKIDFLKVSPNLWRLKPRVEDPIYRVVATIDVSVPDLVIRDTSVRFLNYPRRECEKAAPKIEELIGVDIRGRFPEVMNRACLGPQGCDTLFNLVNLSCRGLMYAYMAQQVGLGGISTQQYREFFASGIVNCGVTTEPFAPKDCAPSGHEPGADAETPLVETCDETEPAFVRTVTVDYFELDDDLWRARPHIVDYEHNIFATVDVSAADLVVRNIDFTYLRQPYPHCSEMKSRAASIVGSCLVTDYRQRVVDAYGGAEGCGPLTSILTSITRGFLQTYLWRRTATSRLSPQQKELCEAGLRQDCIACNS